MHSCLYSLHALLASRSAIPSCLSSFCLIVPRSIYSLPPSHLPISELNKNPPEGVSVGLSDDDNMFMWELLIVGPADTVSVSAGGPFFVVVCVLCVYA